MDPLSRNTRIKDKFGIWEAWRDFSRSPSVSPESRIGLYAWLSASLSPRLVLFTRVLERVNITRVHARAYAHARTHACAHTFECQLKITFFNAFKNYSNVICMALFVYTCNDVQVSTGHTMLHPKREAWNHSLFTLYLLYIIFILYNYQII